MTGERASQRRTLLICILTFVGSSAVLLPVLLSFGFPLVRACLGAGLIGVLTVLAYFLWSVRGPA